MRKIDHRAEGQPEAPAPDMNLDAGMGTGPEGVGRV